MKKIAIGCGIILVIAAVAAGVGSWYAIHKAKGFLAGFTDLAKVPDIERTVSNQTPYSPPETGELTEAQVNRLLAVQEHVKQTLGARYKELDGKYKELSERINKHQDTALDFPQVVAAYRDLAGMYVEAKRAQADALNQNNFSLSEYKWVRKQAYLALGIPVMDMDVSSVIDAVKSGKNMDTAQAAPATVPMGPSGPDKNKALVEPHKKVLEDNAPLSFFGL
jgi:butyrate kinase